MCIKNLTRYESTQAWRFIFIQSSNFLQQSNSIKAKKSFELANRNAIAKKTKTILWHFQLAIEVSTL